MFGETIVEKVGQNIFFKLPTKPDSSDAASFFKDIAAGAELQDADGNPMTQQQADEFIASLP